MVAVFPWQEVLDHWFGASLADPGALKAQAKRWFQPSAALDHEIAQRFGQWLQPVAQSAPSAFKDPPRLLAGVLVLDQFPRHIYRGKAKAFAFDQKALQLLDHGLEQGWDEQLHPLQTSFLYMPLQHCENLERQQQSLRLFERLVERADAPYRDFIMHSLDYARQHLALIQQFGRFPYRNRALVRASTDEELDFMARDGRRFGQ